MSRHDPAAYGEAIGADYDVLYSDAHGSLDTAATIAMLAALARVEGASGSVLEFGIGTGRLGLGLLEHGLKVVGVEGSASIAAQLRAKPRGDEIDVVVGDFVTTRVEGSFSVVLISFNTIFAPSSRADQIECFRNAARHLEPGGCFVLDAYVVRPEQLGGDWSIWPRSVGHEHVELQLARYDPATSRMERTLVHLQPDGVRLVPVKDMYAWPGELDLMADAAGLRLRSRAGGWKSEPFDAASHRHVSIYER